MCLEQPGVRGKSILLNTAYFAPAQYYCKLIEFPEIIIEKFESYGKQSYRNRCNILGANGILQLSVPVEQASRKKTLTKDVRIAYHTDWQRLHWRSIEAAYKSSPYYEFYIDDLIPFFNKEWDFLLDLNREIQQVVCRILDMNPIVSFTEDYVETASNEQCDFRDRIHPKKLKALPDPSFKALPYTQVFSDRFEFIPNLSILDVIFNLGPESRTYLESCIL